MNPGQSLRTRWAMLSARERILLQRGGAVIGLALLWWVAMAPALSVLRAAPQQHQRLDAQLQRMQALQAQAQALQQSPQANPDDDVRALQQSVRQQLGASAQLQINGTQATVTFQNLPADALLQWLTQARSNAHATVTQARLKRNTTARPTTWSGTLMLALPAR